MQSSAGIEIWFRNNNQEQVVIMQERLKAAEIQAMIRKSSRTMTEIKNHDCEDAA